MAIKLFQFLAICLIVLGFTFIASKDQKNFLEQSSTVVFPCPTGSSADYYSDDSDPFYNNNFNSALSALANCNSLSNVIQLSFTIKDQYITRINMFQQVFDKTNQLQNLSLDLSYNQINDAGIAELKNLFSVLPNLQYLVIDLSYNQLTSITGFVDAFSNTSSLQQLTLIFGGQTLNSLVGLQGILNPLKNLQSLFLQCSHSKITEIPILNTNQQSTKNLNSVQLVFQVNSALYNLNNLAALFSSISQPINTIYLDFISCNISDISTVLQATNGISVTDTIYMNFGYNQISSLTGFEDAFLSTTAINSINTYFYFNKIQISDNFWIFLRRKNVLSKLTIFFGYNQIKTLGGIERAFENLKQLTSLTLYLNNNQITDVSQVGIAFQNLFNIQSFTLFLNNNQINNTVIDLTLDIYYNIAGNGGFCPFLVDLENNLFQSDKQIIQDIASTAQKIEKLQQYATCSPTYFDFYY